MQAKGLEQSRVETRSAYSYALAFMVNPRGPDHLMTETLAEFGMSPEMLDVIEKVTGDKKYATPYINREAPGDRPLARRRLCNDGCAWAVRICFDRPVLYDPLADVRAFFGFGGCALR